MNYLYSILGTSAFFLIFFTLMDWETKKRDARQRAEWDKPIPSPQRKTNCGLIYPPFR